ncbi:hypothetical protein [Chryseobacterium camelliae]|uniref:hypothetical protein n=1 Tax=Chryseobacterium camelliae TaxID=1265445 RepID=UPI002863EEBD|nr:hypothetical protein [Chryseobacterium camelliae]MDR6514189.1 fumarate reductase subunit D [Chryseobacterium camelliae]
MRRIYYLPGLISALIIPLLFWYLGNQKFNNINVLMIGIYLPFSLIEVNNYQLTQIPVPVHILFAFILFINISMFSIKERFLLGQK